MTALYLRFRDRRDGRALERVFDALAPELLALAMHLVRDLATAEDVLQTTFQVAIERASRFRSDGSLRGWLYGILVKEAAKARRRAARRERTGEPVLVSDAAGNRGGSPLEEAVRAELPRVVAEAVRRLPEPYRTVVDAVVCDQREPVDVAREMQRAPGTVRMQLHRGLNLLRDDLPRGLAGVALVPAAATRGLSELKREVSRHAVNHGARFGVATGVAGSLVPLFAVTSIALIAGLALARWGRGVSTSIEAGPAVAASASGADREAPLRIAPALVSPGIEQVERSRAGLDLDVPSAAGVQGPASVRGAEGSKLARAGILKVRLAPEGVPEEFTGAFWIQGQGPLSQLLVQRQFVGSEPQSVDRLPVGNYSITVVSPDRLPCHRAEFRLAAGEAREVVIEVANRQLHGVLPHNDLYLELRGPVQESRWASADAAYAFDGLVPGSYQLSVMHTGEFQHFEVEVGRGPRTRFDPELATGVVAGRIEPGVLACPVSVSISRVQARGVAGFSSGHPVGPNGSFRFEGLSDGEYLVTTADPHHSAAWMQSGVRATCRDGRGPTDLVLRPSSLVTLNVWTPPSQGGDKGCVVAVPIPSGVMDHGSRRIWGGGVGGGPFRLPVAPGRYWVYTAGSLPIAGQFIDVVEGRVEDLVFSAEPGRPIRLGPDLRTAQEFYALRLPGGEVMPLGALVNLEQFTLPPGLYSVVPLDSASAFQRTQQPGFDFVVTVGDEPLTVGSN